MEKITECKIHFLHIRPKICNRPGCLALGKIYRIHASSPVRIVTNEQSPKLRGRCGSRKRKIQITCRTARLRGAVAEPIPRPFVRTLPIERNLRTAQLHLMELNMQIVVAQKRICVAIEILGDG